MSVRANREELIQKGILLPDPTIGTIQEGTRHFRNVLLGLGYRSLSLVSVLNCSENSIINGGDG